MATEGLVEAAGAVDEQSVAHRSLETVTGHGHSAVARTHGIYYGHDTRLFASCEGLP